MYSPEWFVEEDPARIAQVIAAHPLCALVVQGPEGLLANHVPVLFEAGRAIGHIALANDLHRSVPGGSEALLIFQGHSGYISPDWYPSKAEHHRHVPTWNYEVVHLHGAIRFHHEVKRKLAVVGKMTRHFEALSGTGWRMADAPRDYMDEMLANIVAFEVEITRVQAKAKLGQNRAAADLAGAAAGLEGQGQRALAQAMRARRAET